MITYDFLIAGLLLRVESARLLTVPDNFSPFLTKTAPLRKADILVEVLFGPAPEDALHVTERFFWREGEQIIRQEGQVCRLYIPESFSDDFCRQGQWLLYLGLERMLLPRKRLILHASAVIHQGKAYLFSAPSGGGKSTHAALWQTHYGAKLLNGDKVIIEVENGTCMAYGSPVAGSSGIYENLGAPIGAIFVLHKAKYNQLSQLPKRSALLALYSEAIKCPDDPDFNTKLLDLLQWLQNAVPVFSLECLPEKGAVDCILTNLEGMT